MDAIKKQIIGKRLGALGIIGIVVSEIYKFFSWQVMTITGEISIQYCIRFAFPEFYIGLAVLLAMIVVYFIIDKNVDDVTLASEKIMR